jgi:cysteine desulfurase
MSFCYLIESRDLLNPFLEVYPLSKVYLDYAATTPAHPEVIQAMLPYFSEKYGNASSLHSFGQEARSAVEKARVIIAAFIKAAPDEVIFTSGGTESDNTAILGIAYANRERGDHIITSSIEHHAVIESCHFMEKRGFKVSYLPVDKYGMVNPDDVKKALTPRTILVTIMHASNEVGTIQPISEIGRITQAASVYFHTDAVQTFGHLPIDVSDLKVDLLSVSGHKLCAPKGIGILYIRKGTRLAPFMLGGGQEDGRRGSTYNTPGIVGLGKAVEIAKCDMEEESLRLSILRDRLIEGLQSQIDFVKLNGHPTKRLPNNVNISLAYVEGEAILLTLDFEGVCASTGSACSSESMEPSHVLTAMCIPAEESRCSIRFSLGKWTSQSDIDKVLEVLPRIMVKLRGMSPLYKKQANKK